MATTQCEPCRDPDNATLQCHPESSHLLVTRLAQAIYLPEPLRVTSRGETGHTYAV